MQSDEESTVQELEGECESPPSSEGSEQDGNAETRIGASTPEPTIPFIWEGGPHAEPCNAGTHAPNEVGFHEYVVYVTLPVFVESSTDRRLCVTEIRIEDDGKVSMTQVEDLNT